MESSAAREKNKVKEERMLKRLVDYEEREVDTKHQKEEKTLNNGKTQGEDVKLETNK